MCCTCGMSSLVSLVESHALNVSWCTLFLVVPHSHDQWCLLMCLVFWRFFAVEFTGISAVFVFLWHFPDRAFKILWCTLSHVSWQCLLIQTLLKTRRSFSNRQLGRQGQLWIPWKTLSRMPSACLECALGALATSGHSLPLSTFRCIQTAHHTRHTQTLIMVTLIVSFMSSWWAPHICTHHIQLNLFGCHRRASTTDHAVVEISVHDCTIRTRPRLQNNASLFSCLKNNREKRSWQMHHTRHAQTQEYVPSMAQSALGQKWLLSLTFMSESLMLAGCFPGPTRKNYSPKLSIINGKNMKNWKTNLFFFFEKKISKKEFFLKKKCFLCVVCVCDSCVCVCLGGCLFLFVFCFFWREGEFLFWVIS